MSKNKNKKDETTDPWFNTGNNNQRGGDSPGKASRNFKYGAYVKGLINAEELAIFEEFWNEFHKEFELNNTSDRIQIEMACVYYIRWLRAMRAGDNDSINMLDGKLRRQLSLLKVTRISRQGETTNLNVANSPAEWAVGLLEKAKKIKVQQNN